MPIVPNQASINQGNFRSQDLGKFRDNFSTVLSNGIPISDYSMSEKIEFLKSDKSKVLIKTMQLVSFKKIPILITRRRPLKSINAYLRLWDASISNLVSSDDSIKRSIHSNIIINLAFTKQSNIGAINPTTNEFEQYEDWVDNEIGTSGSVVGGDINQYDPFINIDESLWGSKSATTQVDQNGTPYGSLWPTADSIFRMGIKIFTSKEDDLFFEISANTPFNYLEYPFNKPSTDELYTFYYRLGRNIILSYYQNKNSVYIIDGT